MGTIYVSGIFDCFDFEFVSWRIGGFGWLVLFGVCFFVWDFFFFFLVDIVLFYLTKLVPMLISLSTCQVLKRCVNAVLNHDKAKTGVFQNRFPFLRTLIFRFVKCFPILL